MPSAPIARLPLRLKALPLWQRRLTLAILVSLTLHGLAFFGLRAGRTEHHPGQSALLMAHLVDVTPAGGVQESSPAANAATQTETGSSSAKPDSASATAGAGDLPLDLQQTRTYYLASRLHKAPVSLEKLSFDYPAESTVRDGVVMARILINERGSVDDVIIDKADPPGTFEANTVASLLRARFSPGELFRQPVPSQLSVEVRYQNPEGTRGGMTITAVGP